MKRKQRAQMAWNEALGLAEPAVQTVKVKTVRVKKKKKKKKKKLITKPSV